MNQDRSTTITNSQLKEGYKQTEVGVIPEDWDVHSLGSLLLDNPDYGINASAIPYDSLYPTYLRITDISEEGRFIFESKASVAHPDAANYILTDGNMVFARTGASVGKSYLFNPSDGVLVYAGFLIRVIPNKERLVPEYLKFYTHSSPYWRWVRVNSMRSGQPGINGKEYASLLIPHPPLPEQEAIACTLSDIDALIESLDRLLTKKRQIKQGAMQELLRSKDGWEKKRIGDVLTIAHGRSQHEVVDENGDYPILASGGQIGRAITYLYNKPSVLIGRKGTIDKPQYMDRPFWTVDTLFYSVIHEPNNAKYLFYQFCLIPWREYNEASGVPSLNARTIESIEITVPSPKEQIEIANILSDMDAEIGLIESKLTKTRQIKQGMMHELLTGRIRLVDPIQ
jgi:type I restriction enzyme, S subunit